MDNIIGECLLEARIINGMSQTDLAIRTGVSAETISRWENGKRAPRANDIVTLSRVLGQTTDALLGLDQTFRPRKRSSVERLRMVTK
jgi:transcriptional regulator with XRE-family HTH domain